MTTGPAEATIAAKFLANNRVSKARILIEDRAGNTAENALFTKQLISSQPSDRWVLITSAAHMPRAIGCFRKVDFASGRLAYKRLAGSCVSKDLGG